MHPFTLNTHDNGGTSITYTGFGSAVPCRFGAPDVVLSIDSERINCDADWSLTKSHGQVRLMELEIGGMILRTWLDIHAVHNIPVRYITLLNTSGVVKKNIEIETFFQLDPSCPYAVLSSCDELHFLGESPEVDKISTAPLLIPASAGQIAHVSSLVLKKLQNTDPGARSPRGHQHRSTQAFEQWGTNVEASPAYRFLCPTIGPTQVTGLAVAHWFLKTTTDSCGFSGFAYVVPSGDWKATLACLNAPTHIETGNFVVDGAVGLLSPIAFYDGYSTEQIEAAIETIGNETSTVFVQLIHPENVSNEQVVEMHDSLQSRERLQVVSVNNWQRSLLAYQLRKGVFDQLCAGLLADAPGVTNCIAVDGDISADAITAALYGDGDVMYVSDVRELCTAVAGVGYETVSLVGHTPKFESQLKAMLFMLSNEAKVDRLEVENVNFEAKDGTEWAFRTATRQTIVNAALSVFVMNDFFYIRALEEIFLSYCQIREIPGAEALNLSGSPAILAEFAVLNPDQTVRGVTYASVGPPGMILGVLDGEHWEDAALAGSFARAKKLPAYFLDLDEATAKDLLEDGCRLDLSVALGDVQAIDGDLSMFQLQKLGKGAVRAILHLPRKAMTIFSSRGELPWELLSWRGAGGSHVSIGSYLDVGRMGGRASLDSARVVWRSLNETHEPMFGFERVLFAWDAAVDDIIGDSLEPAIEEALARGFMVDALVPPNRLGSILSNHGALDNLLFRDASTKAKLLHLLGGQEYSVIFLAAHGGKPEDRGCLEFAGEALLEHEFPQISGYPVIVLNSCWAGRAIYNDVEGTNAGIAVGLLDRGAFQVVAPTYPVSGMSAAAVSQALLTHGLTRSASRVLRQLKYRVAQQADDSHPVADVRWFVAYGDSTAAKFFSIDGLAEMEDVAEKVSRMVLNIEGFADLPRPKRLLLVNLWHRQTKSALARARKWGQSALNVIEANETHWGSAGRALRESAEAEYERLLSFVDQALAKIERAAESLRSSE